MKEIPTKPNMIDLLYTMSGSYWIKWGMFYRVNINTFFRQKESAPTIKRHHSQVNQYTNTLRKTHWLKEYDYMTTETHCQYKSPTAQYCGLNKNML